MKHFALCAALLAGLFSFPAQAQTGSVGIGTTAPNASAALEVNSTTQGLLLPRLTLAQRTALGTGAIAAPVAGLVIYQTDSTPGLYAYDGTAWVRLGADNLGNHVATQALNLGPNGLVGTGGNIGGAVGLGVRADGGLNLGQNTAGNSVYLGYEAGRLNTGVSNLFSGYGSGYNNTTGGRSLFSGTLSGYNTTTGERNVFLGYQGGFFNATGSNNTALGYNSGPASGSGALDNATALGANVGLTQSNTVVLGNGANVGIGTSAPAYPLDVAGVVRSSAGGFRFPDGTLQTTAALPAGPPAASATVGDVKQGLQAADHAGWVKLDGRAISALTPTQQANARALGLFNNLPNATNRVLKQTGGALLATGGSNAAAIGQNNLPSVNLTGVTDYTGGHSHNTAFAAKPYSNNTVGASQILGETGGGGPIAYPTVNVATAVSGYHQHTATVALGGSNVPLPVEDAYLNVNQFLYLGQ